jgi:hypothetical protein
VLPFGLVISWGAIDFEASGISDKLALWGEFTFFDGKPLFSKSAAG